MSARRFTCDGEEWEASYDGFGVGVASGFVPQADHFSFTFKCVSNAAMRAEVPIGWHTHDLRHRRATTWLAEGKPIVLVRDALGHADIKTTMGYLHLVKEHLRALVDTVPAPSGIGRAMLP